MALYLIANGPRPTSAAQAPLATGATIKTLLQLKSSETTGTPGGMSRIKIKEWGISFDGSAAATPVKCELIMTDGAATVTALSATAVIKFDNYYSPDPTLTFGTTATGYDASSEGSIAYTRLLDIQYVAPTNQYVKQFPLGLEPAITAFEYLRVRVTAAQTVNAYCYVLFEI